MYYPDLSPSVDEELVEHFLFKSWENYDSPKPVLYVGWLAPEHSHPTGEVPSQFVDALLEICQNTEIYYKGSHRCEYCLLKLVPRSKGQGMRLESMDIEVIGDTAVYYAPGLILHYVADHHYLPPQEFIDAVLSWKEKLPRKSSRVGFKIDDPNDDVWWWPVAKKPDELGLIETVLIFRKEGVARLVQKKLHTRGRQSEMGAMNLEAWVEGNVDLEMGELRATTPNDAFPRLQSAFYLRTFSTDQEIQTSLFGTFVILIEMGDWARHLTNISKFSFNDPFLQDGPTQDHLELRDVESSVNFDNPEDFLLLIDEIADPEVLSNYLILQKSAGRLLAEDKANQEAIGALLEKNVMVFKY